MKLLITGATGFLGRNLLLTALKKDQYRKIILPVRSVSKLREQLALEGHTELPKKVEVREAEAPTWNFEALEVDHAVHSAGILFAPTRDDYFKCNVTGTLNLMPKLKGAKRILILSSQAATGPCAGEQSSKSESDVDRPVTWYGASKLEMETKMREQFSHLPYLCLRPPMVLGPRDSATLPLFKMAKQPVQFKPGGQLKHYSFIGVNDLVDAIFKALEHTEWPASLLKHYFVASPQPITDKELITTAVKVSGGRERLIPVPQALVRVVSEIIDRVPAWGRAVPTLTRDRAKEIWPDRWVISPEKFSKDFGWTPSQNFKTVMRSTYEWYASQGML